MNIIHPDQESWLAQVEEEILDPERAIIDPHHHLWPDVMGHVYNADEFSADVTSGHNVVGTMFMECSASYRTVGPEHEKSLGETEYVMAQAARMKELDLGPPILGMVGHVDLSSASTVDEALDMQQALAGDFFRGVRNALACPRQEDLETLLIPGPGRPGLSEERDFREGVKKLGDRGLTYDTWQYHYQVRELTELARACPDTTMILDHLSTPLGTGSWESKRDAVFQQWQVDLRELSTCPNVFLKLGGLAMPDNGYGWHVAERPPSSDELLHAQGHWYRHALDCFGAERCMFESNFPVDRLSLSYTVYYNAMKKLVAEASESEKDALFAGTAIRVYGLTV